MIFLFVFKSIVFPQEAEAPAKQNEPGLQCCLLGLASLSLICPISIGGMISLSISVPLRSENVPEQRWEGADCNPQLLVAQPDEGDY